MLEFTDNELEWISYIFIVTRREFLSKGYGSISEFERTDDILKKIRTYWKNKKCTHI